MQPRGMQTQTFLAAIGSSGSDTADGRHVGSTNIDVMIAPP
jgi:hypothetical protein